MSGMIEVIPYMKRVNKNTGAVITKFSTLPYGDWDDWETVVKGYTWRNTDSRGTVTEGMHRMPVDTVEEANEIALMVKEKFQPNVTVVLG